MGLAVGRRDKAASPGVQGLAVDAGHGASGGLAQGDAGGEVHAVDQVPVGDVGGSPPGRNVPRCFDGAF